MAAFLGIFGILCIVYYTVIVLYAGLHTTFAVFWLVLGLLSLLGMIELRFQIWLPKLGRLSEQLIYAKWKRTFLWVRVCVQTTVIAGVVIFGITEGFIISEMFHRPPRDLDYIVVLGAKISGNQAEPTMEKCLAAALEYLEENPGTKVIVSGNESGYENLTQAQVMGSWLQANGISSERIILENRANSVQENIAYSYALMTGENPTVGLVTMDFHAYRARAIAAKEGIEVSTIPSKIDYILQMNNMVYEFFAVIKDKLIGNI